MYGWRGRLGLILPADNTVVEVDVARRLPSGVSSHVVRLSSGDQRDRMVEEAPKVAPYLLEADVNVVGYMCAASSFMLGPTKDDELRRAISSACSGLPTFTSSTAMCDGLHAVGATRVAVLSPHPLEVAEHLRVYLEAAGFVVTSLTALGMGLRQINSQYPADVYRAARKVEVSGADGLFIAATNWRALDVIEAIESDLGLPVVTSNQCCLWAGIRMLGVASRLRGLGRLVDEY